MFQVPPPTRYDLSFKFFGFPVRVHPLFWLMGIIFGYGSGDPVQLVIWVAVVFVSILIHEFGHALAFRAFGWDSYIVLHMFGGLAVPTSSRKWGGSGSLTWLQHFIVSLAGPFAGFLLAAVVVGIVIAAGGFLYPTTLFGIIPFRMPYLPGASELIASIIGITVWINVFWGMINLVPVFPLDGGQAARAVFVRLDPWNGVRKALWVSLFAGGTMAIAGLVWMDSFYMAFLFGILAFQSYQMLQVTR